MWLPADSDEVLKAVIEGTTDAVFVKDVEGRYLLVNDACARFIGKPREEVIGRLDAELYPPETARRFVEDDRRVLASGGTCVFEGLAEGGGGGAQIYRVTKGVLRDSSGEVVGTFGISHDMTEYRRAEDERLGRAREQAAREEYEAVGREKDRLLRELGETAGRLREQKLRLANIMASVPGVVWEAWGQPDEGAQRIDFVSDHVEDMLGYTKEEWLSEPNFWLKIVHPEDREDAARAAAEHFARGGEDVNRFRWVRKDGRVLWVESRSRVINDASGRPLGMRGVTLDVTERRRAERALRESEERFSKAFAASPLALTITSLLTGRLLEVNETFTRLSGYTREEAIGRTTLELGLWARESDREAEIETVKWLGQVRNAEYRFVMKDGTERTGLLSAEGIEIGGEPCALTVIQDITDHKRVEAEREQLLEREKALRAEAEKANRLKDEFLATVSHELRTPLTAILGWAHMLETAPHDSELGRHAVSVIRRNAEQQRQIIEDLLDVSRIIRGNLKLEPELVELESVVHAALDTVSPAADAKNVRLRFTFDPGVVVTGDPVRLQQVIWNLLSNAVKFTQPGGEVRVDVARLLTHVRVEVSDTGQGIAPEFLPYVFDRFRQADMGTTRQYGGLGLGLSIARHLVELHGGSIHAYSAGEGQGATFTVDLPPLPCEPPAARGAEVSESRRADEARAEDSGAAVAPPPLVGLRVLLVDDDEDSLEMLAAFVRRSGAAVATAPTAAAALKELEARAPDVIISDIAMPGEDGYEFMRKVRALGADRGGRTPAVALTAYAGSSDRALALRAGYQRHLSKPVDPAELLEVIADLAGKAKAP